METRTSPETKNSHVEAVPESGTKMRILLIEDEQNIASFIVKGLSAEGHIVDHVSTAGEGISRMRQAATSVENNAGYSLVILDLLLPDGHGRDVLRDIRQTDTSTPVLVLSALGAIEDKVGLLDDGANDYMTKPFAFAEMAARVRALGRSDHVRSDTLTAGPIRLDLRMRTVEYEDRPVGLTPREFALLEYMVRHAGQVLSRRQLLQNVWGFHHDAQSNVVDVYVGYLRRKLDPDNMEAGIETVRGVGYRVRRE